MEIDVNIGVLIGQFVLAAILVFFAARKAPKELAVMNATTAAQYAQAAKLKGEENVTLQKEIDDLTKRLELVENKKFKVLIEFITGDPPEIITSVIEPITTLSTPVNTKKKR